MKRWTFFHFNNKNHIYVYGDIFSYLLIIEITNKNYFDKYIFDNKALTVSNIIIQIIHITELYLQDIFFICEFIYGYKINLVFWTYDYHVYKEIGLNAIVWKFTWIFSRLEAFNDWDICLGAADLFKQQPNLAWFIVTMR